MSGSVIDAARGGDPAAWRRLYESVAPGLRGYFVARRVADPDDLVGEVFLEVARKVGTFEGTEAGFRGWVFTIAHSRWVDLVRAAQRRPVDPFGEVPESAAETDVEAEVLRGLDREALLGVVDGLTPDQRSVVLLRVFGDLSVAETAEVLGKTVMAVKVHHHRAVRALRRVLGVDRRGVGDGGPVAVTADAHGGVTR